MQRPILTTTIFGLLLGSMTVASVATLAACGGPEPKMVAPVTDDGVPANSASEARLAMEGKPKAAPAPPEDPTQPLTTPMSGEPATTTGAPAAAAAAGTAKGAGKGAGKGPKETKEPKEVKSVAGKVSRAECKQTFDHYIDLTLSSDARFDGIPPEMIAQLKEQALSQAQSQKGDPCSSQDVTRTQYICAMSAPTTAAWQRCMK